MFDPVHQCRPTNFLVESLRSESLTGVGSAMDGCTLFARVDGPDHPTVTRSVFLSQHTLSVCFLFPSNRRRHHHRHHHAEVGIITGYSAQQAEWDHG